MRRSTERGSAASLVAVALGLTVSEVGQRTFLADACTTSIHIVTFWLIARSAAQQERGSVVQ